MKPFSLLLLFALIVRLLAFPYTSVTNEGDAVSRIFIAWQWLEEPKFIPDRGWPPLHFYMLGASLKLWFDPVRSPSVLHILLSIATAIPLWAFARREWGELGALFVGAAYLFYPLSWRLGYLPASEVPFVFFVAIALYFLSCARSKLRARDAIFSGISMSLAAALRFEAWALIPLLALVLWGKWKQFFLYLIFASVFPVFWMSQNVLHGLAPISHMTTLRDWELKVEAINEGLNVFEILRRLVYFPTVVFFGLTPPVAVVCAIGGWITWKNRAKRVWLFPFAVLLLIFLVQVSRGMGATTARFSLILGLLFLPFSAAAIQRFQDRRWVRTAAILCILLMIPLSYSRVVLHRLAGSAFPNPVPADLEAIPKIRKETKEIATIVRQNLKDEREGLLLDFFGKDFYPWKDTFYVALMSHHHPSRIWIMPGGRYQPLNKQDLQKFLSDHPAGILLRSSESRFIELEEGSGASAARIAGNRLLLNPVASVKSITVYRYGLTE
jgi:hypothetical protein